ncbi:hypothetical protein DFH28DRAFT_1120414 [Melampsora americana]|nr:hypothetical protein DFH28DRAFT_1140456 [Melampsora americana]KAH9821073.1 hypothetical protein DFH28DRAFT_1120414 [Melampsora americana]
MALIIPGSLALRLMLIVSGSDDHFGVIRALLDVRLIPRVVTGTSAGALIAAFLCTHTEEELGWFIVPELADMITACSEPITYDTVTWAKKITL